MAHCLLTTRVMRFAPLLLAAVASVAQAQTTLDLDLQGEDELTISPADCGSPITVGWTVSTVGAVTCSDLRLWVTTESSCGDTPTGNYFELPAVAQSSLSAGTGTVTLDTADLPFVGTADGGAVACGTTGHQESFRVCGMWQRGDTFTGCASEQEVRDSEPPVLTYDALAPAAPTLDSVVPNDSALAVRVTAPADAVVVLLYAKEESQPDSAYAEVATFAASAGQGRITGLTNGVSYSVIAYAEDEAQNRSAASAAVTGTPIDSEGFFGTYQRMGGSEQGGCSTAGGGMAASLALLVLGALMRRRQQ